MPQLWIDVVSEQQIWFNQADHLFHTALQHCLKKSQVGWCIGSVRQGRCLGNSPLVRQVPI